MHETSTLRSLLCVRTSEHLFGIEDHCPDRQFAPVQTRDGNLDRGTDCRVSCVPTRRDVAVLHIRSGHDFKPSRRRRRRRASAMAKTRDNNSIARHTPSPAATARP